MVLPYDNVDFREVGLFGSKNVSFRITATIESRVLLDARLHSAITEEVAVEIQLGGHEDGIEIEPPNPLCVREFVESIYDGGEFGPNLNMGLSLDISSGIRFRRIRTGLAPCKSYLVILMK